MILSGSIVKYQCKAVNNSTAFVNDVVSAIRSDLLTAGLIVVDYTVTAGSWLSEIYTIAGDAFSLDLQIKTSVDYADDGKSPGTDIQSIVDHYVNIETVNGLQASSVPDIKVPSGTPGVLTGQPSQTGGTGTQPPPKPPSDKGWWDSFTTWLEGLGTGGFLGVGLALVAVVLIIGLVQTRKVIG